MSSIENSITHDHMYSRNSVKEKDCNKMKNLPNKNDDSLCDDHRIVRKKCDIQTNEDRKEYIRRRTLNNSSCRISRIHCRSKFDSMIKKCIEYEDLNRKLKFQELIIDQVINQLKEHLRTLVPNHTKQNE
ncbi:unnamed protein product [Rotaria sp. Silwood2]|nr:unnamed protein product [Rotaria sp. Silwood2]CAF2526884.1 unnamed protein product [Rotaria sp. Silwood2]CAF2758046.1 unnamed protein product [Rotaria sp. Silwood2]CAF2936325.1 unnamed protein product [Rotaria sp. Silwood2]CAF4027890.1 unnamed protein product [Rotaria sp. Silwood2]